MENVHGVRVTGGSFPAAVWKNFMSVASMCGTPATTVTTDDTLAPGEQIYTVCSESYKIARPDCPETMELVFPAGSLSEYCGLKH
jgi:hypothetical protein